jgi:hypothetical protein
VERCAARSATKGSGEDIFRVRVPDLARKSLTYIGDSVARTASLLD